MRVAKAISVAIVEEVVVGADGHDNKGITRSYLLPVTMCGLMLPPPAVNQFHFGQSFFSPTVHGHQDDQIPNGSSNFLMNQNNVSVTAQGVFTDLPKPPMINRRFLPLA
ncbi:hypothetical protein L1987_09871 [Smallanthus sonchifolius]|uniref:Uncharacterized protein n=1 Tax=Smallanthus sonchifolius TaxID=185202 RepID=A0ACB9JQJ0_9ASTR|nr:hypothetical protein L1987_09871 [Smallanthus sonchifolius]